MSYQGKGISNWFRIVSLDSKLPRRGNQSYPKLAIKVTNIKDMNIKISFFYSRIPPHVFHLKQDAKEVRVYLFTIIILTLFTLGVTLIGRSKLTQVRLKLLQVRLKLPHLVG